MFDAFLTCTLFPGEPNLYLCYFFLVGPIPCFHCICLLYTALFLCPVTEITCLELIGVCLSIYYLKKKKKNPVATIFGNHCWNHLTGDIPGTFILQYNICECIVKKIKLSVTTFYSHKISQVTQLFHLHLYIYFPKICQAIDPKIFFQTNIHKPYHDSKQLISKYSCLQIINNFLE